MKKLLWLVTLFYFSPVYADWWFSVVDTGVWSDGSGIDIDSVGRAHIVYHEKYMVFNPDDSTWVLQYKHGGYYPRIKLDSKGLPDILVSRIGPDYIWKDTNEVWHEESDMPLQQGTARGFDLDSEDYPHIVYGSSPHSVDTLLFHCWKDSAGWHEEIIDSLHYDYPFCKVGPLIVDKDVIHVAYSPELSNARIHYAKKVDNVWYKEIVEDYSNGSSLNPSLAIDTLGNPCIAWMRYEWGNSVEYLKFARRDSLGWQVEVIDSIYASTPALCIDKDNNPRIFYNNYKYAWFDGNSWNYTILFNYTFNKSNSTTGSSPSMKIDDENFSHICVPLHDLPGRVIYVKGHGFVGIEESEELRVKSEKLKIYPNPFVQWTDVRCQMSGVSPQNSPKLQVYDMMGRLVEERSEKQEARIGKNLPSGIYFVKARGYKTTKTIKMGGVK